MKVIVKGRHTHCLISLRSRNGFRELSWKQDKPVDRVEVITTEGGNCSTELASEVTGLAKKCRNTCHYVLVRKVDTCT